MPQALNKAEQDFFASKGETVADSLKPAAKEAAPEVAAPAAESPSEPEHKIEEVTTASVQAAPEPKEMHDEAKTAERQRLIKEMGLVPLEALQEARGESKALKEEMRQLREWQNSVTSQLRQTVPPQPQEEIPDANQDPIAYQSWAIGKLAEQNQQIQEWQKQQVTTQQSQAKLQQAAKWANAQEQAFTKDHPEYPKAWAHVVEARRKELQALGIRDPGQAEAIIAQDALMVIAQALQGERNPAEILWDYAKARGFEETPPKAPVKDKTVEALERIAAGQQAAGGLKGGASAPGKMSPQELAAMPVRTSGQRAAFAKAWKEAMG